MFTCIECEYDFEEDQQDTEMIMPTCIECAKIINNLPAYAKPEEHQPNGYFAWLEKQYGNLGADAENFNP